MKLLDFLNSIIIKGQETKGLTDKQYKQFDATNESKRMANLSDEYAELNKNLDKLNEQLKKAKDLAEKGSNAGIREAGKKRVQGIREEMTSVENRIYTVENSFNVILKKISKKLNLTTEQANLISKNMLGDSDDLIKTSSNFEFAISSVNKATKSGFDGILSSTKTFFKDFGVIGLLIGEALEDMEKMQKKMIDFNRSMSLGFSNNMLGMDLYGTSNKGSLNTIAGENRISPDELLSSLKGFDKGNSLGNLNDFSKSQDDMQKFGVAAAQLSKFYGVEMGTVNTITSNLVYNFGAKIKDLNEVFEHGKEVATAAGISVKGYFENLKQATEQSGKYFIPDAKAMEGLALYASKTGQSVNAILQTSDKFKNFTSQWQLQNEAAAHAMNETANATAKIWANYYTGDQKKADLLYKGSLAKDIINNGQERNGVIDNNGLRNLQRMNVSPDDIATVQRFIKMQKDLNITMEEYLDVDKQSLETKKKIAKFDRENSHVAEQLGASWEKLKGAVLDPLKSVLGPLVDGLLTLVTDIVDLVAPALKWILQPIYELGKIVKIVTDAFSDLSVSIKNSWLGKLYGSFGEKKEDEKDKDELHPLSAAVGAGELYFGYKGIKFLKNKIGSVVKNLLGIGGNTVEAETTAAPGLLSKIGKFIKNGKGMSGNLTGDAAYEAAYAPGLMSKIPVGLLGKLPTGANLLKGGLIGAGIGIGGNLLGGAVGGRSGETIKTAANWAGTGATIGTLIAPGIGTAIGAIIGGVGGMVKDSWADIDKIWEDGSTGLWASLEHHSISTLNDTYNWIKSNTIANAAFNRLYLDIPALVDGITNLNGNLEKKSDNFNISPNLMNSYTDTDSAWKKIMEQRKSDIPMAAEAAREERMKRDYNPQIHISVNTTFDKVAKTRIQNKA